MDVSDKVIRARMQLISAFLFLTEAILRITPIERKSLRNSAYMATDGKHMFYDPDTCKDCNEDHYKFLVAHEICHPLFGHFWRRGNRDWDKWNQATDMAINQILRSLKLVSPPGLLYPPSGHEDCCAEKLYDLIDSGEIRPQGDLAGSHEFWVELPVQEIDKMKLDWQILLQRVHGLFPGNSSLELEFEASARIPWYKELGIYVRTLVPSDYSNSRFRRVKGIGVTYYTPRLLSPTIRIAVALDSSGSISDEWAKKMLGHVCVIASIFDHYEILYLVCDAAIQKVYKLGPGDPIPTIFPGRGGTDFRPVFEYIAKEEWNPDCIVYFTDSYGTFPSSPPPYPVIWGIVGNAYSVPWGKAIEVIVSD